MNKTILALALALTLGTAHASDSVGSLGSGGTGEAAGNFSVDFDASGSGDVSGKGITKGKNDKTCCAKSTTKASGAGSFGFGLAMEASAKAKNTTQGSANATN